MGFVYAALWLFVGLVLILSLSKEHKIFYFAGGFFIFLGVWWFLDSLWPDTNLFGGRLGMILRIVTFAALVVLSVFFLIERRKTLQQIADGKSADGQSGKEPIQAAQAEPEEKPEEEPEESPAVEEPVEEPAKEENNE